MESASVIVTLIYIAVILFASFSGGFLGSRKGESTSLSQVLETGNYEAAYRKTCREGWGARGEGHYDTPAAGSGAAGATADAHSAAGAAEKNTKNIIQRPSAKLAQKN